MKKLKYTFEYFCSPIWIEETNKDNPIYENIDIFSLPINKYLKDEIDCLNNIYQSKFNESYPPEPLFYDLVQDLIFVNRVIFSYKLLQKELKYKYVIIFDIQYWKNKLYSINEKYQRE
jgi:hypothetical protein